jgi:hypothetical protein
MGISKLLKEAYIDYFTYPWSPELVALLLKLGADPHKTFVGGEPSPLCMLFERLNGTRCTKVLGNRSR